MKREYTALIDSDWQDRTIKEYLREELNASSGIIKSLKARNGIYVNKAPAFVSRVLKKDEILTLILEEEEARSNIPVVYGHLDVIYEDEDILILNKPPNMPVHPSPGHERDTLSSLTAGYYAAKGQNVVCRFVNRLDCGTSGLIVMAKHALAHSVLASQLHTNAFKRGYLAVTEGKISRGEIIDAPILAPETGIKRIVALGGQPSRTQFGPLEYSKDYTLLELLLHTGRTHQIRAHMAYIGHPLYGDWLYGREFSGGIERPALHSAHLELIHPLNKRALEFDAPMPEDMLALLERLRAQR